jgi:hypothetical protein
LADLKHQQLLRRHVLQQQQQQQQRQTRTSRHSPAQPIYLAATNCQPGNNSQP